MYTHKLNDAEVGYDINRALFIDATPDGTINKIKYRLTYRSNGLYYRDMLKYLIKDANSNFGTAKDSTGLIDWQTAEYKTWKVGARKLSIVTYQTSDKYHPFVIEIIRS